MKFGILSGWRKRYALGWLKERIADGDYDDLLSGAMIDELNDEEDANSYGSLMALAGVHFGLSAAEILAPVAACSRLNSAGQGVRMH